jgi:hypothetical protein
MTVLCLLAVKHTTVVVKSVTVRFLNIWMCRYELMRITYWYRTTALVNNVNGSNFVPKLTAIQMRLIDSKTLRTGNGGDMYQP